MDSFMGAPVSERPLSLGTARRRSQGVAVAVVLVIGLAVRLAILANTTDLETSIADERQYVQLAASLAAGHGFAWASGEPTSLRPPLYPAFVAGIWTVSGGTSLQAVRLAQIALSLLTAVLVYEIGRRAFNPRVGLIAGAITWLYPKFIFLDFLILGETLFTLWLVAFVLLAVMLVQRPGAALALACGFALGLGTLTRSVLWPMPVLFCPLLLLVIPGSWARRLLMSALVLAGFAIVVTPWAVRNTRLQGVVTIVDTMGGLNLRMGNYEHTPEDRMWDAVSVSGDRSWVHALTEEQAAGLAPMEVTEGFKDKWAQQKALEYMRAHPGTTLRRAAIKFADFWGLERSFIAGVQQGLYSPPTWFTAIATVLMLVSYTGVAIFAAAGAWLTPPAWRLHLLLLLPILLVTGIHSVVFGHSRYHLPLVPILTVYAAALWNAGLRRSLTRPGPARVGALIAVLLLLAIWTRQIVVVDGARIEALVSRFWS
jgi:4-amino-4-deoxy-L-arabinose transferase-like glycosyltransferase